MVLRSLVLTALALTLSACNLSGTGEKGPFKATSTVTLAKLNGQASQIASQTLNTKVYSNRGSYSFSGIRWSGWAQLQVSGQYFNEFTANTSTDILTLDTITKKDRTFDTANVHLFSHLAAARIRQRVASGQNQINAWKDTQTEMKQLFGLKKVSRNIHRGVEQLSLLKGSGKYRKDNANLLLFTGSFLVAGGDSASLVQLTTDFADDGQFNGVGSVLFNIIASTGATDGLLGDLSSNLHNYGIGNPPNDGDMSQLPIWVNQDTADNEAPVVTVDGTNPVTIVVGTPYVDEGASATDNMDGTVDAIAINSSDVIDTAVIGTHTVTYNATDVAGNVGSATRIVNVVQAPDTESPVIILLGDNPETLEVDTGEVIPDYQDPGYTVTDNRDDNLTVDVIGTVQTDVLGTYVLTYTTSDVAGNDAIAERMVEIVDTTDPVITLSGANAVSVVAGTAYEEQGATATDNYYGIIDVVVTGSVDIETVGTYTLTYTAEDGSNNVATKTRTVTVTEAPDTTAPVITLLGDASVTVEAGTSYTDAGATASDNKDGDITIAIEVGGAVNVNVPATYILTYSVQDSATNAADEITRTVIVKDTIAPTLTLSGNTPLVIQKDTNYTDAGATATDSLDGDSDITANIIVNNPVNTSTPATYTVTYTVSDAAGNPAEAITRSVRVNAPPTANAGADVTVETGNSVNLVGSGSDTDGAGTVTYQWKRGGWIISTSASYSYTPENSETLTFEVRDSDGAISTDTVGITVNLPAPYQIVFINDTTEVSRNFDSALFTQGLTAITSVIDSNGDVVADAVPTFDVSAVDLSTPATYPLVFSYTDSYNRTITSTLTVIVVNHAPIVTSDNITVDEDSANNAITLIARDTDRGDTLTYTYAQATNGTVTGTGKNVAYTPNANYAGADSFTFTVSDGLAESTGTINITVTDISEPNTAPVASSQSVSVDEDSNIAITLVGTDADAGDTLTYSITEPSNGVLSGSGANVTYTPNPNYAGTDSFDFTVTDGTDEDTATVSITVNPLGDAPVATPQPTIVVDEDSSNTPISLSGADADGDTLIFEDISGTTLHGYLDLVADGTNQNYRYTPDEDYSGSDSFTFTVSDGTLTSVPVTINITVTPDNNHEPVGNTQATITVAEDSSNNVIPTLTATDTDGDTLTFEDISGPTLHGYLDLVDDGTNQNYTYTPDEDYSGSDSFTFTVTDGDDESASVTINISVTPDNNHEPVGNTQATITVAEDSSNNVIPTLTATDTDGDTLTFEDISGPTLHGYLELVADGTNQNYTYTPDAGYVGADSFTFTVNDGDDVSAEVTINIEVEASVNSQNFNIAIGDIVTDGQPAVGAGNIEDSTSIDIYTFTATAGQNIAFDFKNFGSAGNNSFGFNTYYIVKDSLGNELLNQRMTLSRSIVIPTTGDYTVTVDTIGNYFGTYQLQLKAPYSLVFTNNPLNVTVGTTPDEFDNLLTNNTSAVAEFADSYIPVLAYDFNANNLLTEGSYPLTVTHTDAYGRTESKDITIIVDSGVVPEIQIVFSQNPMYVAIGSDEDDVYFEIAENAIVVNQFGDVIHDAGYLEPEDYLAATDLSVAGSHNINFSFYDDFENLIEATLEVIVTTDLALVNQPPRIGTLFTLNRTVGNSITIDNSTPAAYDTDGTIVSYSWTVNGVEIATTPTFQYIPTTVGEHRLTLKVVDNDGVFTLATKIVNVIQAPNVLPTADAGRDKNIEVNNSVHIAGSGSDSDGTITAYNWTENGTSLAITAEFDYTPSTVGDHTLTLTVTDNRGGTAFDSIIVTATAPNQAPIANAGADTSVEVNSSVTLSGSASSDDSDIVDYSWYENGVLLHSSNQSNFSYTPASEGLHTITLTVMDDDGVTASDTVDVTVTPAVILSATCPASPATEAAFIDMFVNFGTLDTPWPDSLNNGALSVDQIASAFNTARATTDPFELQGKALVMPAQAVWDGYSDSQKALYLINSERCARGILPYEGISLGVEEDVAQYYADYLADNNVFGHNEDGSDPFGRLSQLAGVVTPGSGPDNADFFSYAENLASNSLGSTGSFPTVHEPVAKAIYAWMYDDKEDTKTNINEPGATPHYIYTYGHRKFILATGLVENSGEVNKEGLIGIGVSTVQESIDGLNWTKTYTVMNAFDPNENWFMGDIETVDFSGSNQCLDGYIGETVTNEDGSTALVCSYGLDHIGDFNNHSTVDGVLNIDISQYYLGDDTGLTWTLVSYEHVQGDGPGSDHYAVDRDEFGEPTSEIDNPNWISIDSDGVVNVTNDSQYLAYWSGVVQVEDTSGHIYTSNEFSIDMQPE